MGLHVISGEYNGRPCAIMFCSTSMWAFGPLFEDEEEVDAFCVWLRNHPQGAFDPRTLSDEALADAFARWKATEQKREEGDDLATADTLPATGGT